MPDSFPRKIQISTNFGQCLRLTSTEAKPSFDNQALLFIELAEKTLKLFVKRFCNQRFVNRRYGLILDQILQLYVEENQSAREIVARGFDEKVVRWIQRRVDLNEYKREQAAPGIKVTSRAFGVGRRMPIAQQYVDVDPDSVDCAPEKK